MQIPKDQILSLLKGQGDDAKAQQAEGELPETVDTDEHAGLLSELGINPAELIAKLAGGGAGGGVAGGIAGKLGF
jgi:leucyl aminopeptidase (aminopeptidase T)